MLPGPELLWIMPSRHSSSRRHRSRSSSRGTGVSSWLSTSRSGGGDGSSRRSDRCKSPRRGRNDSSSRRTRRERVSCRDRSPSVAVIKTRRFRDNRRPDSGDRSPGDRTRQSRGSRSSVSSVGTAGGSREEVESSRHFSWIPVHGEAKATAKGSAPEISLADIHSRVSDLERLQAQRCRRYFVSNFSLMIDLF